MKTKYLTNLTTQFSPFSPHSKVPRLVLALIPPTARSRVAIKTRLSPRALATEPAVLQLGFKDGTKMEWKWEGVVENGDGDGDGGKEMVGRGKATPVKVADVVEAVDRHYRGLARKEELSG